MDSEGGEGRPHLGPALSLSRNLAYASSISRVSCV